MKIYDISVTTTSDTVTWENKERGFGFDWAAQIGAQSPCYLSVITSGAHVGTHIDAPLHFVPGGNTVEMLDVQTLIGPAQVVQIYGRDTITAADLDQADIPEGTERILFRTDNTRRKLKDDHTFHKDYIGVAPSAAAWLVQRGVKLVGVDYISVGPYGDANVETHRILLGAAVIILEALALEDVSPGAYTLIALPPKYAGVEAAPCRVVLLEGLAL